MATRASVGHLVAKPNDLSFKSYSLYLTETDPSQGDARVWRSLGPSKVNTTSHV